ncbi:4-alpha-glucanotransferase [Pantoea sp. Bo_2]|uniref:4-alpha-glucanotransferase n=1 Tax=unclassified Pantoea TaxID=2630326 RepID=UPI0012321830|nr:MULTISPECIES: 4-alpha-glucanotransferase [unclassified Pantoea]KAA5948198.1 4-alpha-glucanotransferase [Pantoea sp. VH_3]KAA5950470.1 4-alpha-glucanotransferase [Pantoea sp. VH_24]KAA5953468.1 4-alpha-glucanotransferase [Pantoea sp. VH_25]KAA5955247.1 4-alpha-glucanotransferase [Pantoea sp. VH_16]KAA5961308.1 4-alpha-glucanotransferase [Pantoea sp. VH_18]
MKVLDDFSLAGIAAEYINAHGMPQAIPALTRQRLLAVMQPPHPLSTPLPPAVIFRSGESLSLSPQLSDDAHWHLISEAGEISSGRCQPAQPLHLPPLPEGYHQLTLQQGAQQWSCRVIITPARCYEPPQLLAGESLWGACVQLYTLRSAENWGIGDFGDLRRMLPEVSARGGAFIGLNPVHALFPSSPESASPYSPSSRRWLNVLYIDVNAVADFQLSTPAQAWWQRPETQQALEQARAAEWVDYAAVTRLKIQALSLAWPQFIQRDAADSEVQAFNAFIREGGESLLHQALFDALHADQMAQDSGRWGWPVWPEALQHPASPAVQTFLNQHQDQVRFWLWLQWLAAQQLADCWNVCQQQQMPIGLYRDLAVGVAQGGAETWSERDLYCMEASIGAPPDILGPRGQDWGLPPMDPQVMRQRAWEPWIALLRASMRHCGALRIDHVMALMRLWWIPAGESAMHGAYVHYPIDDLLAILALESQRHRCMVIGEDLGTVPEAIVDKLRDGGVYSYKVLWFEQTSEAGFRPPASWPRQAMAVATTHDLPTLRGWWQSDDLTTGAQLGLYPDKVVLAGLYQDRRQAKQALLNSLHRVGALPKRAGRDARRTGMSKALNRAMQRYLADSHSALLGLQPEDWLDMAAPVNIPGTSDEYPNWRRKLSVTVEALFSDPETDVLLRDLTTRRKRLLQG